MVLIITGLILLFAVIFTFLSPAAYAEAAPEVSAASCVLMCEDGSTLFEKDADTRRLIASTTKLMTALVCLENADLNDTVTASARHCAVEGSSMYLRSGERYSVRELLLGLLLASGNDAALALAEHTAGSEAAFVRLMNDKARSLGLADTHFENPHGLDADGHFSTARDLARLMLACMENPAFRELDARRSADVKGQILVNHNKLLTRCPGCVGGKTGYTMAAGRCLVSCCEREGLRLVCVSIEDPDDWDDHAGLYDWAYEHYALRRLSDVLGYEVPVITGSRKTVRAVPPEGARAVLPKRGEPEALVELPRFVFAPVESGERAGSVSLWRNGKRIGEYPLTYTEGAKLAEPCLKPLEESIL